MVTLPTDTTIKPLILVVDDDAPLLCMVEKVLQSKGYSVVTASCGETAIEWCQCNGPPDLLLTDVRMPGMAGPILVEHLSSQFPEMPVLFMSGTAGDDPNFKLEPLLEKPFSLKNLVILVTQLLAGCQLKSFSNFNSGNVDY